MTELPALGPRHEPLAARFVRWVHARRLSRFLAIALAVLALVSVVATYGAFTAAPLGGSSPGTVVLLLNIDLVLLLLLAVLIVRRLVSLGLARRNAVARSRLHRRLSLVFSLVAVTPAIIVALFSALFLNFGIENWFSERVSTAVKEAVSVAEAYYHEHRNNLRADALAMAHDLNREAPFLVSDAREFQRMLDAEASLRGLTGAVVFDGSGQVMGQTGLIFSLGLNPIPPRSMEQARQGEVVVMTSEQDDQIRALLRLDGFLDAYLYIARFVDPVVLSHLDQTEKAAAEYQRLEGQRSELQVYFLLVFVVVALLLMLTAVWLALTLATHLVRPITEVVSAAERIRGGDLGVRVTETAEDDEIGILSGAFNRMTAEIERHRRDLVAANEQLDTRRRFTEAVLAGVSAGVIGLDAEARVTLPNRRASELLDVDLDAAIGERIGSIVPEMEPLVEKAGRQQGRAVQSEISRGDVGARRTLLVRVLSETGSSRRDGLVITIDDVTELEQAQRQAAWADVARRIAHEIKNPLTPIQLSAERLKRRYLKQISSDPETFSHCIDTITRHVDDIGRMVDEFSSFARMPSANRRAQQMTGLIRESVVLQRSARSDIDIRLHIAEPLPVVLCDARQVRQAVTNLLQNAIDAVERRQETEPAGYQGRIAVEILAEEGGVRIMVGDNGCGLPADVTRERLTEPYVTTRHKGTGLGLAIVKKIMEDHEGTLSLTDRDGDGAEVSLLFPADAGVPADHAGDEAARPAT